MHQVGIQAVTEFERGSGQWAGVVMITRPDNLSRGLSSMMGQTPECTVASAKLVQLNGRRAVYERMPYQMFRHLFRADDGDSIFHEAEYKDGHLEIYERSRASMKDWVLYSATPELLLRAAAESTPKTTIGA